MKHNNLMLQCSVCDKNIYSNYDLKNHEKLIRTSSSLKCEECPKTFKSKIGLQNHVRRHSKNNKFLCDVCGKGFNYKHDIEAHKAKHEGVMIYSCDICNNKISCISNKRRHINICQKKTKEHCCSICSKKFKAGRYLEEHKKAHKDPERFQCSTCGSFYKYRASLYKHSKKTDHS